LADIHVDSFLPLIPALQELPAYIRQRVGWEGNITVRGLLTIGHYAPGVGRERIDSALLLKDEELVLPDDLDYFR
jgi:hypothetical protein